MIIKTEAIVLRTVDFKESSIIATLFTKANGKLVVIAKGARKPKSKYSAYLVPGQILEVIYYHKSSRSVQTLSDVSYSKKLHTLRVDLEKMALATTTLELSSQLLHEHQVNKDLFDFLKTFLAWINDQDSIRKTVFPYVQLRLAQYVGIGLQITEEQESAMYGYINISSGVLSSEAEDEQSIRLTSNQFAFVKNSLHSTNSSILKIGLTSEEVKNLIQIFDKYFIYHIEGIKPRKSDRIFDQLLMK